MRIHIIAIDAGNEHALRSAAETCSTYVLFRIALWVDHRNYVNQ